MRERERERENLIWFSLGFLAVQYGAVETLFQVFQVLNLDISQASAIIGAMNHISH
jgi:hypothetical protein